MFEKSRSSNVAAERTRLAVRIGLTSGEELAGHLVVGCTTRLADALNGSGQFLEFEDFDGTRRCLNKAQVHVVRTVEVPRADQLAVRMPAGTFDPWQVLGVARDATPDTLRTAYLALARAYHPDRFQSVALPKEMADYAGAMLRRINLAYETAAQLQAQAVPASRLAGEMPVGVAR